MLRLSQEVHHSKKTRVIIKLIDCILGELFNYFLKMFFRYLLQ